MENHSIYVTGDLDRGHLFIFSSVLVWGSGTLQRFQLIDPLYAQKTESSKRSTIRSGYNGRWAIGYGLSRQDG
jgi:hypothetical protein